MNAGYSFPLLTNYKFKSQGLKAWDDWRTASVTRLMTEPPTDWVSNGMTKTYEFRRGYGINARQAFKTIDLDEEWAFLVVGDDNSALLCYADGCSMYDSMPIHLSYPLHLLDETSCDKDIPSLLMRTKSLSTKARNTASMLGANSLSINGPWAHNNSLLEATSVLNRTYPHFGAQLESLLTLYGDKDHTEETLSIEWGNFDAKGDYIPLHLVHNTGPLRQPYPIDPESHLAKAFHHWLVTSKPNAPLLAWTSHKDEPSHTRCLFFTQNKKDKHSSAHTSVQWLDWAQSLLETA